MGDILEKARLKARQILEKRIELVKAYRSRNNRESYGT